MNTIKYPTTTYPSNKSFGGTVEVMQFPTKWNLYIKSGTGQVIKTHNGQNNNQRWLKTLLAKYTA